VSKFTDFNLLPSIQKALDSLEFTTPTEIQEKAIPLLLSDLSRDIHAQAQTGTGKTLAFGIPLLQSIDIKVKDVQGLIVAPTRELVLQIYESLKDVSRETGITLMPIYGGMSIQQQISSIKRGPAIIIGTPGRLNDHLRRRTLSLKNLKTLVLDEADIMLDMGFRQEVDTILDHAPSKRQIWLFSATVLNGIKQLINSHMSNVHVVKSSKKTVISSQVEQYYCVVPKAKRVGVIARFIQVYPSFYGIIFCQTKLLTSEVSEQLASFGFRANCLHGDMKQALRNQVIKGFKNKDFNILVATDVAARGIDISDLTHVINFSLPQELESYVHRIGRTGRAGKKGTAILFIAPSESYRVKRLQKITNVLLQEIPVPPKEAIIQAKMSGVADFIEQSKKERKEFSDVHTALEGFIGDFSEQEIKQSLISALEDLFFKGGLGEDFSNTRIQGTSTQQEICISLGADDDLEESEVREYLHSTCTLLPQEIRKLRILNKRTFISLPENRLEECLNTIKKNPISPIKHRAFLVEDNFPSKGGRRSRESSSRDRGDSFSRDNRSRRAPRRNSKTSSYRSKR